MTYEELIVQFGARYRIEGLASQGGVAALVIDGNKIGLISDEAADAVVVCAEIGFPPPEANGKFGEVMLKANHLFLGTGGGTLCQNPDTDAYVLMRPVPLSRLESAEAFGAMLEEVLSQVENWQQILAGMREAETSQSSSSPRPARQILAGMREAETAEGEQKEEAAALSSGGFIRV